MRKRFEQYFETGTGRWQKLKRYLSTEILIEYKACLYFCTILFFYFCYLGIHGSFSASVPVMVEMVLFTYGMCYLQMYLLQSLDDADRFGPREGVGIVVCSICYAAASWIFFWFGREGSATVLFWLYMMLVYTSVYLANKVKRRIDTELLNQMLDQYKMEQKEEQQ